jgi:hypothetical protein
MAPRPHRRRDDRPGQRLEHSGGACRLPAGITQIPAVGLICRIERHRGNGGGDGEQVSSEPGHAVAAFGVVVGPEGDITTCECRPVDVANASGATAPGQNDVIGEHPGGGISSLLAFDHQHRCSGPLH